MTTHIRRWRPFDTVAPIARFPFSAWFDFTPDTWRSGVPIHLGLDVTRDEDSYTVEASLPGVSAEDIDVTIDHGVLKIVASAEKDEGTGDEGKYLLRERRVGSFYRAIRLPEDVDADNAETAYRNGVLYITLPKHEGSQSKKLEVKAA